MIVKRTLTMLSTLINKTQFNSQWLQTLMPRFRLAVSTFQSTTDHLTRRRSQWLRVRNLCLITSFVEDLLFHQPILYLYVVLQYCSLCSHKIHEPWNQFIFMQLYTSQSKTSCMSLSYNRHDFSETKCQYNKFHLIRNHS